MNVKKLNVQCSIINCKIKDKVHNNKHPFSTAEHTKYC